MKNILTGMSLMMMGFASSPAEALPPKSTPNIIVILADDMGYGDLNCYGATRYNTPNIDKLASDGVRFTNFYVSQAVCSASRAALLTGCYSNRVGIAGALMPKSNIGLNPNEEIIPEILKKRGYFLRTKLVIEQKWFYCLIFFIKKI